MHFINDCVINEYTGVQQITSLDQPISILSIHSFSQLKTLREGKGHLVARMLQDFVSRVSYVLV